MRRAAAGIGLLLAFAAAGLAVFFFLRENWAASATPGPVERLLAGLFLSNARRAADERPNPLPATAENLNAGKALYEQQCAFCHGQDGAGPIESKVQFYPPVPSLAPPQNELTDAQLHFVIRNGIRYTGMPSFEKALTEEQIWQVVLWLKELQRNAAVAGAPEPAINSPR